MTRLLPLASLLTLSLSACASPLPPDVRTGGPLPPRRVACSTDGLEGFVGQAASADVVEQARLATHAGLARVLHPGDVVTMEFRDDRLNVEVDERGVIVRLRCG